MAPPDNSTVTLVVEDEISIAWGIKQLLVDLAGRALTVAMLAKGAPKDGVLVVTAERV